MTDAAVYPASVERWGVFELSIPGPDDTGAFSDPRFAAEFSHGHRSIRCSGFYAGPEGYRVRFMPDEEGEWSFRTRARLADIDGVAGSFDVGPPATGSHGPVRVANGAHFAYDDGTPYRELGTTCYAWTHQGDELEEQTLATLSSAPFNKIRMCVFPKDYAYNLNEPELYPYERGADGLWDFARFNPAFFSHFERRISRLGDLGIQADLILFHPYDRWGFGRMSSDDDDRYLRYVVARLAAFRNVWWSLANEFDLMPTKSEADWDRFFRIIQAEDHVQHPRSIHNCHRFYDHSKPWVTHCSIQRSDVERTREWREQYRKPVVIDECCYEGDIPQRWGDITAEEMVRRFWETTVRGGYCGHGETYADPNDVLWWSKGGVLRGQSPARLAFLRSIVDYARYKGLDPVDGVVKHGFPCCTDGGGRFLAYFGVHQPRSVILNLPEGSSYRVDVIDTWGMSIEPAPGAHRGHCEVALPARPYMALLAAPAPYHEGFP
jgi:hypothetical protein